jgi:putative transposase
MQNSRQLALRFPSWGGRRSRAGRPAGSRPRVAHRTRPEHRSSHPVHVTLRSAFRPLRSAFVFPTVRAAIADSNRRAPGRFRIVHFSVQTDHLHLLVEAADKRALSSGLRGLSIRIARRVNALVDRRGKVWADRWHGHVLTSPRATRRAVTYVLANFRKHDPSASAAIDSFSSAPHFNGFREHGRTTPAQTDVLAPGRAGVSTDEPANARPLTWLLRVGWLRAGPISIYDAPSSDRRRNRNKSE